MIFICKCNYKPDVSLNLPLSILFHYTHWWPSNFTNQLNVHSKIVLEMMWTFICMYVCIQRIYSEKYPYSIVWIKISIIINILSQLCKYPEMNVMWNNSFYKHVRMKELDLWLAYVYFEVYLVLIANLRNNFNLNNLNV